MKWKLFLRNLSVSSPRMTVRSQMPWPLRALLGFLVLAAAAAVGVAVYEYGRNFGGPDRRELSAEVDHLRSQLRAVTAERDRYAALATAGDTQLKVDRGAQEQLAKQVVALESDLARARADLAFFESLLPAPASAKGLQIRSFRVEGDDAAPNQMRFRLLVQQSGNPKEDFRGTVQLQVNYTQGSKAHTLQVPDPNSGESAAPPLTLSFRHYQRVEGSFVLPAGAVARSVLVRVVARGQTQAQAQQSFNL
jgi:hypothetical protein